MLDGRRSNPGVGEHRGLGMTQVVEPDAGDASFLGDTVEFPWTFVGNSGPPLWS
jgi:hypothetical protein